MKRPTFFPYLNRLKVDRKLFAVCILSLFIPTMLIGIYFSLSMGKLIGENEIRQAQANVDRIENTLVEVFGKAVDIANRAYVNGQIYRVVEREYQTSLEVYAAYSDVNFFDNYLRSYNEIAGIRLYVENPTMLNNSYFILADADVKKEDWYNKAKILGGKMFWAYRRDNILRSDCLSLIRQIRNTNTGARIGVFCVNLDIGKLKRLCEEAIVSKVSAFDGGHVAVIALDGEVIYASTGNGDFALKPPASENWVFTNSYVPYQTRGEFQIFYSIPKRTIFAPVYSIFRKSLVIVFGALVLALGAIFHIINEVYIEKLQKEKLFSRQKEMQLKILSNQINPHFLYNTLETIRMMALSKGEEEISVTIKMLSKILRQSFASDEKTIPLKTELELVRNYLSIQKLRFGERVDFSIEVADGAGGLVERLHILPLLIQPLVENSFVHGLETKTGRGCILIRVWVQGETLIIEVADNGAVPDAEELERARERIRKNLNAQSAPCEEERIGLANVNQRIKLFYGADYGLELASTSSAPTALGDQTLSVRMYIPAITT
ncbi:MAG: sensor histidine kinase [Treponema sp.]|jgi:two-component system sensor histidine kinase YesM|nr:sensor histidine kinase [Treponema sp.]